MWTVRFWGSTGVKLPFWVRLIGEVCLGREAGLWKSAVSWGLFAVLCGGWHSPRVGPESLSVAERAEVAGLHNPIE